LSAPTASSLLFEIRGVSKAFPGVRALEDVSLEVRGGEVHALVGQNGAGKSTLIKTLCGAHHPDRGEFVFNGERMRIGSPADARRLGIAVIFQEFSLVPYLNVAQNIFLGRERGSVPGIVDRARVHADARRVLNTLGLDLDTRTPAHRLGIAQQQMVEIAKALSQDARILVMDEPTAALSDPEIARLFEIIRKLKRDGVAIVYVSHRLHEIFELADRITVLRDGRKVAEMLPGDARVDDLVRLMVGREVSTTYRHRFCETPGPVALDVQDLRAENGVRDVSLRVSAGEIVGLAGLVGAGRTEVVRAIFGADRVAGGRVQLHGEAFHGSPVDSVGAGVGLVPEDRKAQGLALVRSVQDNLLVSGLRRLFPDGWYRPGRASRVSGDLVARLGISTPSTRRLVKFLSGGNQQKVVIGKWLNAGSRLFIFDEPTRGIDVGAKAEVYRLMEQLVADGAAVLMTSSELPEVVSVCDRVYVMRDKTIVGELRRPELTEENILRLAMHHSPDRGGG
jgi:ribose transport system ATP-binding protein